ncbi:hypothetical protein SLE2022_103540 [Rubroshorea leprosula]
MADPLDMSLDDLIKSNKKGAGKTRGGRPPRNSGPGPSRRFRNRGANRAAPYSKPVQAPDAAWQHDMFVDDGAVFPASAPRASSIETGTKLYISNLDYGVSNEDIKELFAEVGDLKRYAIHYDRSGRSKGTAEVVFSRRTDALAAVKRYNGVQLDGKPMKIEIVGTNVATPAAVLPPATNGTFSNQNGAARSGQGRGGMGRGRGGGRGARRGRGQGRGRGEKISADDLDADLEKYHQKAMETE